MVNKIIAQVIQSLLLFNLILAFVLWLADAVNRGISLGFNVRLEGLYNADDICLFSHKYSDISAKLQAVSDAATKTGLKVHVRKTKAIWINTTEAYAFHGQSNSIQKFFRIKFCISAQPIGVNLLPCILRTSGSLIAVAHRQAMVILQLISVLKNILLQFTNRPEQLS